MLGLGLSALHRSERGDLDRAKRYAMDQSIKHVMQKQQAAHQENVSRILCNNRLYINFYSSNKKSLCMLKHYP